MNVSVEISMYPLQDEYLPAIDAFLKRLNETAHEVEIRTSNMSTRLFGEYQAVTCLLQSSMEWSMQSQGKVVFVCKYLAGDARELETYD